MLGKQQRRSDLTHVRFTPLVGCVEKLIQKDEVGPVNRDKLIVDLASLCCTGLSARKTK